MIDFFFFGGFNIQNDSLAMMFIALTYEHSNSKCTKIQVHYQLKFDMPQAGYSCIISDMAEVEKNLTVAENLVAAPGKGRRIFNFCQGNVKLSSLI